MDYSVEFSDNTSCSCPNACDMFSYTTLLSFSQLTGLEIGSALWNSKDIDENYLKSLELAYRVQAFEMIETVDAIRAVIINQKQLQKILTEGIINPGTSIPVLILNELIAIMSVMQNDFESSRVLLDRIKNCYDLNVSRFILSLCDQLRSTNMELFKVQAMGRSTTLSYIDHLWQLMSSLLQVLDTSLNSLRQSSQQDYCPNKLLEENCLAEYNLLIGLAEQKLEDLSSLMNFTCSPSEYNCTESNLEYNSSGNFSDFESYDQEASIADRIRSKARDLTQIQSGIMQLIICVERYSEFLKSFQLFLSYTDSSLNTIDTSIVLTATNNLLQDSNDLEDLLIRYYSYNIGKYELSNRLLSESNGKYMLNVEIAVSSFESSVSADLLGAISTIEARLSAFYMQLLSRLCQMNTYMPIGKSLINDFTKALQLMRNPIPMPLDRMVKFFFIQYLKINSVRMHIARAGP